MKLLDLAKKNLQEYISVLEAIELIPTYTPDGANQMCMIDSFVSSSRIFFDHDSKNGYEISREKLEQIFNEYKIVIKGFNDNQSEEKKAIVVAPSNERVFIINDEDYLKIIEEELIYIPKVEIDVFEKANQNTSNNVIDLSLKEELNILVKSDYFDIFDSACLMSLDEPSKLNSDINYSDDWKYREHNQFQHSHY